MRTQRMVVLLGIISLVGLSLLLLNRQNDAVANDQPHPAPIDEQKPPPPAANRHDEPSQPSKPPQTPKPLTESSHPIAGLMNGSEASLSDRLSRQSRTLSDAVKEYKRRYGMHPPPKFDIWFKFAQEKGVQLIDEFDTIHHSILPFWGLSPKVIRERAREAIGFDNALISLLIRDGHITKIDGGGDGQAWKRDALTGMMKPFIQHLPDMDLPFNMHDEPRVVLQSEDLHRLVSLASDTAIPSAFANKHPKGSWSPRPSDLNKGDRVDEVRTTRFNRFAHQATWTHARVSCPIDSPARDLNESRSDAVESYARGEPGFLYNITASSDICLSPSLRDHFGLFDRPNAVDLVHDLFPVFSESKVSSYQDILFPSPWYWADKAPYDPKKDRKWEDKKDQMYWRGSTTGGFSRAGGWRRQHRQMIVGNLNSLEHTKILERAGDSWKTQRVPRKQHQNMLDVHFSHIGQCDPDDCDSQKKYFDIAKEAPREEALQYKFLLDMDGNAFSGRYYSFLRSNSLIYKFAVFREWHNEWIYPWVHYVPLSLGGDEHFEAVRYFAREEEGQARALHIAEQSQQWARKVLRKEDLEVWFFRLLLEYGRVIDDDREHLGFSL